MFKDGWDTIQQEEKPHSSLRQMRYVVDIYLQLHYLIDSFSRFCSH